MFITRSTASVAALLAALVAGTTACESERIVRVTETDTVTIRRSDTLRVVVRDTVRFGENRAFNQIERLGAPLFAEVLLEKREHDFHDVGTPSTDSVNFKDQVVKFIVNTAGRTPTYANAVANALVPDMIVAQLDKASATAGYAGQILNPAVNYGGRRLQDDAVDISLQVVFGNILATARPAPVPDANVGVKPGLVTDNVPSDSPFRATFPYLAVANVAASFAGRR